MSNMELVLLGIAVIVGIWIVGKVLKVAVKVILVIAILAGIYIFFLGGDITSLMNPGVENMFKNTTMTELQAKHCRKGKEDGLRCQCFVTPVYNDLQTRFTQNEMKELEAGDKKMMVEQMLRSFDNKKDAVKECLKSKGSEGKEFLTKLKNMVRVVQE